MKRHYFLIGVLISLLCLFGVSWFIVRTRYSPEGIKVGILHSLTGTLGESEKNVVDATMMAIDEINARGGILGRPIVPVIVDGKSDEHEFEKAALHLIHKEHITCIFGCWASASRKKVKPIVEKENCILFYPVQYEGIEQSSNIVYTGAAPNQAIIPGVTWSFYNLGKRFFLVGSDYIFPRVANAIIKLQAAMLGAEVVGEMYIPLGSMDVTTVINAIKTTKPTVIFNTINGSTNASFFPSLRSAGISSDKIPTVSFSVAEPELATYLSGAFMAGDYAVYNYFQNIDREENRKFVSNFKKRYGQDRVLSNNMESAYDNVYLWVKTVEATQSLDVSIILSKLKEQVFNGPGSIIYIDANNHAWREIFIGKIRYDQNFDIVWRSKNTIYPEPYPPYQDQKKWDSFLMQLYQMWGNKWSA